MKEAVALALGLVVFVAVSAWSLLRIHTSYERMLARVATLEAQNAELTALCQAQGEALNDIKAEAADQAARLAKAQAEAAKTRAQSEVRVQTILTAPAPEDNGELAVWATREAKGLAGRLAE